MYDTYNTIWRKEVQMQITEVSVSYGETRTVQFQSARIDVGLRATVKEGEEAEAIETLEKRCVAIVHEAFDRYNVRTRK